MEGKYYFGLEVMGIEILSKFIFGDMLIEYDIDTITKNVGLWIIPASLDGQVNSNKRCEHLKPTLIDPLVHVKCTGDVPCQGFSSGQSLRNSSSTYSLKFHSQDHNNEKGVDVISTLLKSDTGFCCSHILSYHRQSQAVEVYTTFTNESCTNIDIEMITSFSLGRISPFTEGNGFGKLKIHRFRSYWAAEGRHESVLAEDMHLEPSWSGMSVSCERFGQVGTFPVRKFFPFAAIEDSEAGVFWASQVAWPGSWQIEIWRKSEDICISGGLADREFGHWVKTIKPGEQFSTPKAYLTTVKGDIDDVCQRLTNAVKIPDNAHEQELPIIFNEYLTSLGKPSEKSISKVSDKLQQGKIKYFVIDAGWYRKPNFDWATSHGDWVPNQEAFPGGLKDTAMSLRRKGFIPGIWFEPETVGQASDVFKLDEHFLKRDGKTITVSGRKFWDFRDKFTSDYLTRTVVSQIREARFGYVKLDYNETVGIGVDGAESLGEAMRQHVLGVYEFYSRLRKELPADVVIEFCAAGGHRLDPFTRSMSNMCSFSDAHETVAIPIIAANLHRLMLPSQCQIWAVIRKNDSKKRICYTMAAGFLGRICISGDICELKPEQFECVYRALTLYGSVADIIKNGHTKRMGPKVTSYLSPQGWQAVLRYNLSKNKCLCIIHTFALPHPEVINLKLADGDWKLIDIYGEDKLGLHIADNSLSFQLNEDFVGVVAYLVSQRKKI